LLAVITCLLQIRYHLVPLQGGSFLIDYYPVKLVWMDFVLVLSTIVIVVIVASWLPAELRDNPSSVNNSRQGRDLLYFLIISERFRQLRQRFLELFIVGRDAMPVVIVLHKIDTFTHNGVHHDTHGFALTQ